MKYLKQFIIPFSGLKEGEHWFDFKIETAFFECFENEEIQEANIDLKLCFIKRSTMLDLEFQFSGVITAECDRCLDPVQLPVESVEKVLIKFGDEPFNETDEILVIPHRETEINLAQLIYEMLTVAIPMKRAHEEGKCDDSISGQINEEEGDDNEPTDPRWDQLKNLI